MCCVSEMVFQGLRPHTAWQHYNVCTSSPVHINPRILCQFPRMLHGFSTDCAIYGFPRKEALLCSRGYRDFINSWYFIWRRITNHPYTHCVYLNMGCNAKRSMVIWVAAFRSEGNLIRKWWLRMKVSTSGGSSLHFMGEKQKNLKGLGGSLIHSPANPTPLMKPRPVWSAVASYTLFCPGYSAHK